MTNNKKKEIRNKYYIRFNKFNNNSNFLTELYTNAINKQILLYINSKEFKLLFNT
mgnify:CR=1 FL=1